MKGDSPRARSPRRVAPQGRPDRRTGAGIYRAGPVSALSNPFGLYSLTLSPSDLQDLAELGLDISSGAKPCFQMLHEDDPIPTAPCQGDPMVRWTFSRILTVP